MPKGTELMVDALLSHKIKEEAQGIATNAPSLVLAAQHVADIVSQGFHGRNRPGTGEEFWQYRQYQHGDAVRQIDWRRSAKTEPVYIKQREWEIPQTVWLWCDSSPSMQFSSDKQWPEKRLRSEILTLALIILLTKAGERVGIIGSDLKPSAARSIVNAAAVYLIHQRRQLDIDQVPNLEKLQNHSRLVMISDFFFPVDELQKNMMQFARRGGQGCLLQVLDRAEENLDWQGRVLFEGVEDQSRILIERTETVQSAYRQRLLAHRQNLENICRLYGWSFMHAHTDKPAILALISLYSALDGKGGI
ncbi:MAG: DUF58 domain-containing protein [Alphaproteobacteria bacterium]|nr:DUF58 domain-containing protein [Alphaproteobacteria bacterium]